MGQPKFEKEIARQLREREISPQENSWEILNSRLDKENKKRPILLYISGIAAALVTGLLVYKMAFVGPANIEPQITEQPVQEMREKKDDNFVAPVQIAEEEQPVEKEEKKGIQKEAVVKVEIPQKEERIAQHTAIETSLEKEEENQKFSTTKGDFPSRLEEVIAEVTSLERAGGLQEAEVDLLLQKAAAQITTERMIETAGEKVDHLALLREVEMELDQGFRDKVFDILKEGYLKAKTAVANRNF